MDTSDFLVQPVDENFLCGICHNVMVSPCACSEGHQFCRSCISTWLQQSPTCPQRCGDLAVGSLMKNRGAENMINKLQVRCCHTGVADPSPGPKNLRRRSRANVASSDAEYGAGCGWEGALEERVRHLREECAYSEVECSCEGCDAKVLRFQLAEHEASCEHRKVGCEKCAERVKAREMSDHLLGCRMVEIECPQECGARVLRGEVGEHEKACGNVVVRCSFAECGCEVRGKRKKIAEHEEEAEAVVAHARLAARRAGRERERNAELEKQLSAKTKELAEQARQFEHQTNEFKKALAEKTKELEESNQMRRQVRKLEKELQESKRQYGEESVTWKIEGFTAKAQAKEILQSNVFHVQTKAGTYHLFLAFQFYRRHGSETRGFMGLHVFNKTEDGGSANFPVGLAGSMLTVEKGAKKESLKFADWSDMDRDSGFGVESFLSSDKIPGVKWAQVDTETDPIPADDEPEYDVADMLEDDTMTVTGCIRITPPASIAI